jgi:hypothetical protein
MATTFADQAMYTFEGAQILRRHCDRFVPVDHSEIYPDPSAA